LTVTGGAQIFATSTDVYFGGTGVDLATADTKDTITRLHLADGTTSIVATVPGMLTGLVGDSAGVYATTGAPGVSQSGGYVAATGVVQILPGPVTTLGPPGLAGTLSENSDTVYLNDTNREYRSLAEAVAGGPPLVVSSSALAQGGVVYFAEQGYLLARPATPPPADPSAPDAGDPPVRRLRVTGADPNTAAHGIATIGSSEFAVLVAVAGSSGSIPGAPSLSPGYALATYTRDGKFLSVEQGASSNVYPEPRLVSAPTGNLEVVGDGTIVAYAPSLGAPIQVKAVDADALAYGATGDTLAAAPRFIGSRGYYTSVERLSASLDPVSRWPLTYGANVFYGGFGVRDSVTVTGGFVDPTVSGQFPAVAPVPYGWIGAYEPDGPPLWVHAISGAASTGLATDGAGVTYLAAGADGAFDVGRGVESVPVPGQNAMLVVKYGPDGTVLWLHALSRTDGLQVALGPGGALTVAGYGVPDFSALSPSAAPVNGGFVATFDGAGTLKWMQRTGGAGVDCIAVYPDGNTLTLEQRAGGMYVVERGP
jgi:hypothetical protein